MGPISAIFLSFSLYFAGYASAADLYAPSLKDGPYVEAPVNWTGFYVGGVGSYSSGNTDYPGAKPYIAPPAPCGDCGPPLQDLNGAMLGGTVGYNYQFDRFVLGVEGDYSWGDITDSKRDGNYIIEDLKIDGFGTIRGRIGYAVGNFLPYVTGGVSFERMQLGQSCPDQASAPFGWCHTHGPYNLHDSQWNTGYVVGGGVEWKASERVSLKAEVLYTDFGTETYSLGKMGNGQAMAPIKIDDNQTLLRLGANYHF